MRRFKKIGLFLLVLVAVYAVLGFFVFPAVLRSWMEGALRKEFSEECSIAKLRFNPFTLRLSADGVFVTDGGGAWSLGLDRATVDLSARSALKFYPVFDEVILAGPDARFRLIAEEGRPPTEEAGGDWRALVARLNEAEIPKLRADRLELRSGRFEFRDERTDPVYEQLVESVDFSLLDFTTVIESATELQFLARTPAGTQLEWEGTLGVKPLASEGSFQLSGFRIDQLSPYFAGLLRFDLESAKLDFGFDYRLDLSVSENLLRLRNGSARLTELLCLPTDADDRIIAIDEVAVEGIGFRFPQMGLEIAAIEVLDGEMRVAREPDGGIDLLQLVRIPQADEAGQGEGVDAVGSAGGGDFSFKVGELSFDDCRVIWVDRLESSEARLEVGIPEARFEGISSDLEQAIKIDTSYRLDTGTIRVAGEVRPGPAAIDLAVELEAVPLSWTGPYAREFGRVDPVAGELDFEGKLRGEGADSLRLTGNWLIEGLELEGLRGMDASLGWKRLAVEEMDVAFQPLSATAASLTLDSPEGVFNLGPGAEESAPAAAPAAPEAATESSSMPNLAIGSIKVEGGDFILTDGRTGAATVFKLEDLSATVGELGVSDQAKTSLALDARVNGAPLTISGELYPVFLREATTLRFQLEDFSMPLLSNYSATAVGRRIAKGQLSLDGDWSVRESRLVAGNRIRIDQLELGDSVDGEAAVKLPLELAVTLLRGPNGVIDVSLPLSGDLSDPKASLGQIILSAFVGLVTNVAAAPFKLLSGLVETEEDLSQVEFPRGEARLSSAMVDRLNALARALKERPELRLRIVPQIDPGDVRALKTLRLKADLLQDAAAPDEADFERELLKRYREKLRAEGRDDAEPPDPESESGRMEMVEAFLPDVILPESEKESLAARRTEAVREHLTTAQGIDPERIAQDKVETVEAEAAGIRFEVN